MAERGAPDRGLRLGLSSGAVYPTPTELVPRIAADLGVRDLEIMLQTAGEYEPAFGWALRGAVRSAGCAVRAVHTWQALHPLMSAYQRRTDEATARFEQAIELAVMLEASVVVWHGPRREEVATPVDFERFIERLLELGALARQAGVVLGLENVSWCVGATVRDVAAIAKRLTGAGDRVALGFVFDPFQAAEAGANPFMMLAAMGEALVHGHLSDRKEGDPSGRHLAPGDGDLPWSPLLRAIGARYQGPLMVESALGDDPQAAMDVIRQRLEPLLLEVRTPSADPCQGSRPTGVDEGIALFNQGAFYEAHEALEHEWHAERRPIRRLYQGILQIGVGFHHALGGNWRGAVALLSDGIGKAAPFGPVCLGIRVGELVVASKVCLDQIEDLGPEGISRFDGRTIPVIRLEGGTTAFS